MWERTYRRKGALSAKVYWNVRYVKKRIVMFKVVMFPGFRVTIQLLDKHLHSLPHKKGPSAFCFNIFK